MSGIRRLGYKTYLRHGAHQGHLGYIPRQTVSRQQNANARNTQGIKCSIDNDMMLSFIIYRRYCLLDGQRRHLHVPEMPPDERIAAQIFEDDELSSGTSEDELSTRSSENDELSTGSSEDDELSTGSSEDDELSTGSSEDAELSTGSSEDDDLFNRPTEYPPQASPIGFLEVDDAGPFFNNNQRDDRGLAQGQAHNFVKLI